MQAAKGSKDAFLIREWLAADADARTDDDATLGEGVSCDDERHLAPLQLDFIERCIRLWSNPGETVLTPFAGISSEVWVAVRLGRLGIGIELKGSYWRTGVDNMHRLDADMSQGSLFGEL